MRRQWMIRHMERVASRYFYYAAEHGLATYREPRRYSIDSQVDCIWFA
jgi:hypothetical protein